MRSDPGVTTATGKARLPLHSPTTMGLRGGSSSLPSGVSVSTTVTPPAGKAGGASIPSARSASASPVWMLDVGLLLGLAILALALRAPNVHLIPVFTDDPLDRHPH